MNKLYYETGKNIYGAWEQYSYPVLKALKRGPNYVVYFAYDVEKAIWGIYAGDDLDYTDERTFDDIKDKFAKSKLIEYIFNDKVKEVINKWQ